MEYTVSFRYKVSMVVSALDALRDVPVPSLRVSIEPPHTAAIVRSDGFHVFTNLPNGPVSVVASAPGYFDARCVVDPAQLRALQPVVRIRMSPRNAPLATWVRGRVADKQGVAVAGATVEIRQGSALRLLTDAVKGLDTVNLFNPTGRYLGGMLCEISEEDAKMQRFRLIDVFPNDEYELDAPLANTYSRAKGKLRRVHETTTDSEGCFRWPFAVEETEELAVVIRHGGKEKAVRMQMKAGEDQDIGDVVLPASGGKVGK